MAPKKPNRPPARIHILLKLRNQLWAQLNQAVAAHNKRTALHLSRHAWLERLITRGVQAELKRKSAIATIQSRDRSEPRP